MPMSSWQLFRRRIAQAISIDSIVIKQDDEGRYCLNDLHKASGGSPKDQPAHFLALDSTMGWLPN